MPRQMHFPKVVGVRLSREDGAKLQRLCEHTQRRPSELVRLLIRTAQPIDVAPVQFMASEERTTACVEHIICI
jgi:hypothetical protein